MFLFWYMEHFSVEELAVLTECNKMHLENSHMLYRKYISIIWKYVRHPTWLKEAIKADSSLWVWCEIQSKSLIHIIRQLICQIHKYNAMRKDKCRYVYENDVMLLCDSWQQACLKQSIPFMSKDFYINYTNGKLWLWFTRANKLQLTYRQLGFRLFKKLFKTTYTVLHVLSINLQLTDKQHFVWILMIMAIFHCDFSCVL